MNESKQIVGKLSANSHKIKHGDHLCVFYENLHVLLDSLCDFVVPGILLGEAIVVIATDELSRKLILALEGRSIDVTKAVARNQLMILNTHKVLQTIMKNDVPDRDIFQMTIGRTIENLIKKFSKVRVYGDMVNVLFNEKNQAASLVLEKLWGELNALVFCSYSAQEMKDGDTLQTICSLHNHIVHNGELQKLH